MVCTTRVQTATVAQTRCYSHGVTALVVQPWWYNHGGTALVLHPWRYSQDSTAMVALAASVVQTQDEHNNMKTRGDRPNRRFFSRGEIPPAVSGSSCCCYTLHLLPKETYVVVRVVPVQVNGGFRDGVNFDVENTNSWAPERTSFHKMTRSWVCRVQVSYSWVTSKVTSCQQTRIRRFRHRDH